MIAVGTESWKNRFQILVPKNSTDTLILYISYMESQQMWNRFDSNFWYRFSSRIWYRFGSKLTRFCVKFGTDLVPKFGTVFDSRVPKMLVHVFQKFWHLVSENVEPKGSRWWAGLMTDHGRQAYPPPPPPVRTNSQCGGACIYIVLYIVGATCQHYIILLTVSTRALASA